MRTCLLLPPIDALQPFQHKDRLNFFMLLMHYLLMIPCWLSLFSSIFPSLFDEMHIERKAVELMQCLEHKPVRRSGGSWGCLSGEEESGGVIITPPAPERRVCRGGVGLFSWETRDRTRGSCLKLCEGMAWAGY